MSGVVDGGGAGAVSASLEGVPVEDPNGPRDPFTLDDETWKAIVDEAKRAPSPHNTQPARWRLSGDVIELLEDPSRRLFASDPSGRDHRLALGAAWEGTRLALGKRGLRPDGEMGAMVSDAGVVVRGRVVTGGVRDPLVDAVGVRATWRGTFDPVDDDILRKVARRVGREGALLVSNKAVVRECADVIDDASVKALLLPRYLEELVDWTRFSPEHPSWYRDGMNLEALRLNAFEGKLGKILMKRAPFTALARARLARFLVSESAQTASASALVGIVANNDEPDLVSGARLYRAWLTLAKNGLALCPMSVLTDEPALNRRFAGAIGVGDGQRLVHLWRVGRAPEPQRLAVRLPTHELIVR
jgi:hypothetical protein